MERYYADLITVNKALINKLDVDTAKITYATITNLNATNASIENLKTNKLDATYADIINANIENLKAVNAEITNLKANSLTVDKADLAYAKIDFANVTAQVVGTSIIKDGAVTNEKVQSLSANKLTAGTIDASKIIVTNLNADNITVGTINGKRIGTGSLSLDKLAEKVPTKEYLDKVQEELQGQIDGNIETFTKTEIPTLNNEPAVNWADDATRKKHIGDICYVVNPASSADGYSYRFADTGTLEAPNYEWVLIKDSDVTKALQDIININGEITGIKKFDVEISSWKTDTDSELSSLKTRTTTLETDMGSKVDTKTFNEVKQAVDGNSSTITKLTETLNTKADGSTVETLTNTVNTIKQTADSNSLSISGLYTEQGKLSDTIYEVNTKASDAQDWCQNIEDNLSENYTKTTFMNNAITQAVTAESNSIRADVSATYATKDSLKKYATSASLELYIKKDPASGELKSAIEAIADTINITAKGGLNISGDRFTLTSTNTTITADGKLICRNALIDGELSITRTTTLGTTNTSITGDGLITKQLWNQTLDCRGNIFDGINIYKTDAIDGIRLALSNDKIVFTTKKDSSVLTKYACLTPESLTFGSLETSNLVSLSSKGLTINGMYDIPATGLINQRITTSSNSLESFNKTWKISGNGLLTISAAVWTDETNDYGTISCAIYIDNACVAANKHRLTTANAIEIDAGCSFSWVFNDNKERELRIIAGSSKEGQKTITYSVQGSFGLAI